MHPIVNIAVRAARRGGNVLLRYLESVNDLEVTTKGRRDFVTEVDRSAEREIIDVIRRSYPSHGIVAEESGTHPGDRFVWVIDPLDGTNNYLHGFPHFCISIAVKEQGRVEHGVVYDPLREELFVATRGAGAMLNNRRIRASRRERMSDALIGAGCAPSDDADERARRWPTPSSGCAQRSSGRAGQASHADERSPAGLPGPAARVDRSRVLARAVRALRAR